MIHLLVLLAALQAAEPETDAPAWVPPPPVSPEEQLARASESNCLRAARLADARIGAPTRYSEEVEVRLVDGVPPGAAGSPRALLLCLFNRATRQAVVQGFDPRQPLTYSAQLTDVWWQAREIGGRPVVGADPLTLMIGGDGHLSGRSGCNLYSVLYMREGETLQAIWPMTGIRQPCTPANVADQELEFRRLVLEAAAVRVSPDDGSMTLIARDGGTIRFVRAESIMVTAAPAPAGDPQ